MKKMLFLSLSIIVAMPQTIKTDNKSDAVGLCIAIIFASLYVYLFYPKKAQLSEQPKKEQELELKRQQEGKEQAQQEALEMLKKEDALRKQQKEEQIVIMLSKQLAEENKKIKQEEAAILAVKNQKWDDFMQELYEVLV